MHLGLHITRAIAARQLCWNLIKLSTREEVSMKDHSTKESLPITKEYGLNRELMNSIALFVYEKNYQREQAPLRIFNEWATACGIKVSHAETLAGIIEHIRKISAVERKDLEKALKLDNLLL